MAARDVVRDVDVEALRLEQREPAGVAVDAIKDAVDQCLVPDQTARRALRASLAAAGADLVERYGSVS